MNLKLSGCGITVDPLRLATEQAKTTYIIENAKQNAIDWLERLEACSGPMDCDDWVLSQPRLRPSN